MKASISSDRRPAWMVAGHWSSENPKWLLRNEANQRAQRFFSIASDPFRRSDLREKALRFDSGRSGWWVRDGPSGGDGGFPVGCGCDYFPIFCDHYLLLRSAVSAFAVGRKHDNDNEQH